MSATRTSLADRFWSFVNKNGPVVRPELEQCWNWTGKPRQDGYGRLCLGGTRGPEKGAHVVSFFLHHGRWPAKYVLHRCDNPLCVRPSHLFEGTPRDNMRDKVIKRRHSFGERSKHARLTDAIVVAIRAAVASGDSGARIARELKVHPR